MIEIDFVMGKKPSLYIPTLTWIVSPFWERLIAAFTDFTVQWEQTDMVFASMEEVVMMEKNKKVKIKKEFFLLRKMQL